MQAADVGHDIERLVALLESGPRVDAAALAQAESVLGHLERGAGGQAYTSEKLAAVRADFKTWLTGGAPPAGMDAATFRHALVRDIEKLRKAFARRSESQD
jgi:hypothetical protein